MATNKDVGINYDTLHTFTKSKNIWKRRIAIISTHCFIKNGLFKHTLNMAKTYINDKGPLIHKATGWMLREIGKKNESVL